MKKHTITIIVIIGILLWLVIAGQVVLYLENPALSDPNQDDWYIAKLQEASKEYLYQTYQIEGEIQARRYHYTEFDQNIVISNRQSETKQYPFQKVSVVLETRNRKYTVYFSVIDNELKVDTCEDEQHYNPFLS